MACESHAVALTAPLRRRLQMGIPVWTGRAPADQALKEPVVLTRNGRPRTVLLSVEAFERFLANERTVFLAEDTPDECRGKIGAIASGALDPADLDPKGEVSRRPARA